MISCTLQISENKEDLYRIFLSENIQSGRAKMDMQLKNDKLTFSIGSNDPVAMRAFLTSILKTVEVYQKTSAIK